MLKKVNFLFLFAAAALCFASCTVKEDRMPCPCYLNVSFQDRETVRDSVSLLGWNTAEMFCDEILVEDYDPYWIKPVHKGTFGFSAFRGIGAGMKSGHFAEIAPGNQADSLYAYHDQIEAVGDMVYTDVTFHKQFCTVFLDVCKSAEQMKDYWFYVTGNTCGFDLLDFVPMGGPFRFEPEAVDGARIVSFRIPRQVDDSMMLTIYYSPGEDRPERLGDFPLGKYIVRTGYDWSTVDLQDVYVTIDLVIGQVIINVEGWEEGAVFTFIEQ